MGVGGGGVEEGHCNGVLGIGLWGDDLPQGAEVGGWGSSSVWSGWVYGGVLSLLDAPWPGRMETRLHTDRMLLGPGPAAPRGDEGPPWTLL